MYVSVREALKYVKSVMPHNKALGLSAQLEFEKWAKQHRDVSRTSISPAAGWLLQSVLIFMLCEPVSLWHPKSLPLARRNRRRSQTMSKRGSSKTRPRRVRKAHSPEPRRVGRFLAS